MALTGGIRRRPTSGCTGARAPETLCCFEGRRAGPMNLIVMRLLDTLAGTNVMVTRRRNVGDGVAAPGRPHGPWQTTRASAGDGRRGGDERGRPLLLSTPNSRLHRSPRTGAKST